MEITLNGIIDGEILSLDVTKLPQALLEGAPSWPFARKSRDSPDAQHLGALLRPRRQWPNRGPANQRDKVPPFHSITSSARKRIAVGTSRPECPGGLEVDEELEFGR